MRGWILLAMVLVVVAYVAQDLYRFNRARKAEAKGPAGVKVAAGGVLFIQGNKTYYQMPKGTRRKIADFPMDLRPGSKDMNMFTVTMDKAREEFVKEKESARKEAAANMSKVAREEARRG